MAFGFRREDYKTKSDYFDAEAVKQRNDALHMWHFHGFLNDKQEGYIRKALNEEEARVSIERKDGIGELVVTIELRKKLV